MAVDRRSFLRNVAGLAVVSTAAAGASGLWHEDAEASDAPLRPPGALPEADFLATCIRCMRCVDSCPNHCIESTSASEGVEVAGTPQLHPRSQACMLCSRAEGDYLRCTAVCPTGALRPIKKDVDNIRADVHIGVAEIDLNLCYSYNNYTCGTCYHACPLQGEAITLGLWERPTIHPEACIGCGLCERACIRYPHAIRVKATKRPSEGNA